VHFGGFKGLRFLHVLIYPLSDWQQMKLIEQLSLLSEKELPNANKLLLSKNDSVVIFTLKIISVFHNLALHNEVSACLYHENEIIRYHAIKCLQYIFDDTTAGILQDVYQNQGVKNKMAILDVLKVIGGSEQTEFLYLELFDEDDNIKLTAASALMACCEDALDLIEDVSSQKGFPYTNILHHVKEGLLV
jgi:HEAT repeat protein